MDEESPDYFTTHLTALPYQAKEQELLQRFFFYCPAKYIVGRLLEVWLSVVLLQGYFLFIFTLTSDMTFDRSLVHKLVLLYLFGRGCQCHTI